MYLKSLNWLAIFFFIVRYNSNWNGVKHYIENIDRKDTNYDNGAIHQGFSCPDTDQLAGLQTGQSQNSSKKCARNQRDEICTWINSKNKWGSSKSYTKRQNTWLPPLFTLSFWVFRLKQAPAKDCSLTHLSDSGTTSSVPAPLFIESSWSRKAFW